MKRFRSLSAVLTVVLLATALTSCGTVAPANEYAAASQAYNTGSNNYQAAGNTISALRANGHVTLEQWNEFQADANAVRAADGPAYTALQSWQASGVKPADFDALAATLAAAQQKVIDLSKAVH